MKPCTFLSFLHEARSLLLLLFLISPFTQAHADGYAVLSSDETTLTFYYDLESHPGTMYAVPSAGKTLPDWNSKSASITSVVFDASYANALPATCYSWFSGMINLKSISGFNYLNTSYVKDMSYMFSECSKLTSLYLSSFNTQNVTDMSGMFQNCSSLTSLYLSSFNTSKVTYMCRMFSGCSGLTSLGLSSFNTQNVTDMHEMFQNCSSLTSLYLSSFNTQNVNLMYYMFKGCTGLTSLDLSSFNTAKVTYMHGMFSGCSGLTSLDLSHFNTSEVKGMYYMFEGCTGLTSLDLSSFNTEKVTDMSYMFSGCTNLTSLNLSSFNTQNVTNMTRMFNGCGGLKTIFVGDGWSTEKVVISEFYEDMFTGSTNLMGGMGTTYDANHVDKEYARVDNAPDSPGYLTDPDNIIDPNAPYAVLVENGTNLQFRHDGQRLSMPNLKTYSLNTGSNRPGWVVDGSNAAITSVTFLESFASARPTSLHSWFEGMTELTRVWYMERLNTSEVTDMANLFKDCSKLTSDKFDISNFATGQVRDMSHMFDGCVMLTAIDVSHFDTQNVTDMASMFSGCIRLTTLNVSGLNTAKVTDMSKMFYDCGGFGGTLGTLDVTSFDTRQVTDMNGMFYHVTARVDVTGFDTQNVTDMHEMFKNVSAETLDLRSFNTSKVTDMSGMFERNFNLTTITVGSGWTVANVTSSENMFDLCGRLCGDKGTSYKDTNPKDKTYAHIDGGTANPGYLTDANGPYAALSQDGKTLTFYHDGQRLTRTEKTYSLNAGIFANPGWRTDGSNAAIEHVVFDASFADACPVDTKYWFFDMSNLSDITGMEYLNTSEVTLMSGMFSGCSRLTGIDLSHFNTGKVTNMPSMFYGCTGLTTLDLMTFDTGNVLNMKNLFDGCTNLTTIYAGGGWSTAKVDEEWSENMFEGCTNLVGGRGTTYDASHTDKAYARLDGGADSPGYFSSTPAYAALSEDGKTLTFYCDMLRSSRTGTTYDLNGPEIDPDWYNDGSYTDITTVVFDASFAAARPIATSSWFYEMENLSSITGMENLNTSEVTDMSYMFRTCTSLTSIDLSHFDTGKVTNMRCMFNECDELRSLDLSSFNTENVTDMGYMFALCSSLTSIAVGHLNTTKVKYMEKMFVGCSGLTSIDFSGFGFQTGSVTDMNNMFSGCSSLTYLDTSKAFKYGTQNVTDMSYMFRGCSSLTSLNLQPLNTAMVTDMSYMFQGCSSLAELTINNYYFMTGNVTKMNNMFMGCQSLTAVDLSGFDTRKVTTMNRMFQGCASLTSLDLSSFDTESVTDIDWMFALCSSLTSINLSNFNTSKVNSLWSLFMNCSNLKKLDLTSFNTTAVTRTTTMFSGCSNLKTVYVGDGWDMSKVTTHPGMFSGCESIVGGMGTTYDASHVDVGYARVDGGTDAPGYLTGAIYVTGPYAALSENGTTLTFYKDGQRLTHAEQTYNLNEGSNAPGWNSDGINGNVTKVVFDLSFADARPTSTAKWFDSMFSLTSFEGLAYLNTSEVTSMHGMFSDCPAVSEVDFSNFDTSNVTDMSAMFSFCGAEELDLSSFSTENVTNTTGMFALSSLKTIYVSDKWTTAAVTSSDMMFLGCSSLVGGMGTTYDAEHVDAAYAHIDGGSTNPGYFTQKFLLGDVNQDGSITIADVTALVNIILGKDTAGTYSLEAADVNQDTTITIADVTALVNIILGKN